MSTNKKNECLKEMNEPRSIKTCPDLSTHSLNDQTKFRLNEINKIKITLNLKSEKEKQ